MRAQENEGVRQAEFEDVERIFNLVKTYPDELIARSVSDIVQNIDRFLVYDAGDDVNGVVSWQILPEIGLHRPSVEIKSLAVKRAYRKRGIGKSLVESAICRIRELRPQQIIALTFVPDFFLKLGFVRVEKKDLMHKIYIGCANCTKYDSPFTCPEIAVALKVSEESRF